jgi:hypothetical protein
MKVFGERRIGVRQFYPRPTAKERALPRAMSVLEMRSVASRCAEDC